MSRWSALLPCLHRAAFANYQQCLWCTTKLEADKVDLVRKWNANVTLMSERIVAVHTARTDHYHDDERGYNQELAVVYDAKIAILTRAAQSWMLAHPPPPEYAGVMADQGYTDFCPSRLVHLACSDAYVSNAYPPLTLFIWANTLSTVP